MGGLIQAWTKLPIKVKKMANTLREVEEQHIAGVGCIHNSIPYHHRRMRSVRSLSPLLD